ncbi:MAG: ATP-binding cassette domain-containing protein, partial [Legionellaceae bacterium]|nr:ATP-binding cassette domain-containing protein [Legionellaceae bacterium]
ATNLKFPTFGNIFYEATRAGAWHIPKAHEIGYVDQFYKNLDYDATVFESIKNITSHWRDHEIRVHLNHYLFKSTIEVETSVVNLSEGEKARLSFAMMGCQTPKILILDEITNNLDIETKNHVIDVLNAYPGTLIFICHEKLLADQIKIDRAIMIDNHSLEEY